MSDFEYKRERILIWGKTYPELSYLHTETVCTGGVLEDGRPVRLYPIPLRYLDGDQQFSLYQWIEADIAKDHRDARPESYRVKEGSIGPREKIDPTPDEWGRRAEYILKHPHWQFPSVEQLWDKRAQDGASLGIVSPAEILGITEQKKTAQERQEFDKKLEDLRIMTEAKRSQILLFDDPSFTIPEFRQLAYAQSRFVIRWRCHGTECNTHTMQVLDWGVLELMRKVGSEKARKRLEEICDLENYALRFFLGNIKSHPDAFTIVGMWYPKKDLTPRLF